MSRKVIRYALGALIALGALWLVLRPRPVPGQDAKLVLRISHFRPSIPATALKARGSLERKLAPLGVTVQWNEFKATTDSILALSAGAIDISVGGVEGGLAAIASGVPMKIVATGPHRAPKTGWFTAILVRDESPIRSLADLKGKKIAVGRGGFSEAVLAVALRKASARYPEDVQPVYLASADGVNAFTNGLVDAVLTLDPYILTVQREVRARILTDTEQLGYPTIWNVSVNATFAEQHPELVELVAEEFLAIGPWVAEHRAEAAASLASIVGFDAPVWEATLGRASYVLERPSATTLTDIQHVADELLAVGVIRKRVNASEHALAHGEKLR